MPSQEELNLSSDARATVQKHWALSCWSSVAANRQTLESLVNPTQGMGIPALMYAYAGTDQNTDKPTTAGVKAIGCSSPRRGGGELGIIKTLTYGSN